MAHELLSPKKHVDKIYLAYIEGTLPKDAKKQMKEGLVIEEGVKTLPAELVILDPQEDMKEGLTAVSLRIHEGKFHQVKRMFEVRQMMKEIEKELHDTIKEVEPQ